MRIGLFAYGSIVLNPHSNNYNAEVHLSEDFSKTNFKLPLSFSRLSSANTDNERVTLVPNRNGVKSPVFCARMQEVNLSKAIKELKEREGTTNSKNISYVRKGIPQNGTDYKTVTVAGEVWSYRVKGIKKTDVVNMINYLKEHNLNAGLITTFDSNRTKSEIKERISAKPSVGANTRAYYNGLPSSVKKVHKTSLESLGVTGI